MTQPDEVEIIPPMLAQRRPRVQAPAAYLARLSPGSRRAQWQAIRKLAFAMGFVATDPLDVPWANLTADRVALMQAWLRKNYAPATVRRVMSALRGIVSELWRQEAITAEQRDRLLDIAVTRGSSPPAGRALSLAEIQSLYAVADARDKALLAGLLWGGLRRAELERAEILRDGDNTCLRVYGKGGKTRLVWIYGQPAFDLQTTGLTPSGMWKVLDKLAKRAGVRHFSPHDLRRTYASLSLAQGIDLALVQRAMGHADPRTTARYDRRPDEAQAAAARGLADVAAKVYDGGQS